MNLAGKTILLTGAAGGLGSEMARQLCRRGALVFLMDLDAEKGGAAEL